MPQCLNLPRACRHGATQQQQAQGAGGHANQRGACGIHPARCQRQQRKQQRIQQLELLPPARQVCLRVFPWALAYDARVALRGNGRKAAIMGL